VCWLKLSCQVVGCCSVDKDICRHSRWAPAGDLAPFLVDEVEQRQLGLTPVLSKNEEATDGAGDAGWMSCRVRV
jgi:hypothetical protein